MKTTKTRSSVIQEQTEEPTRRYASSLIAPQNIIVMGRSVLGGVDFDPYSCKDGNRLIMAARFLDHEKLSIDDIIAADWECGDEGRVFTGVPHSTGLKVSRRILSKVHRLYEEDVIQKAVLWFGQNTLLSKIPWLWDYPICIPFLRGRPCYLDHDIDVYRAISPYTWSFIVFFPPKGSPQMYGRSISQFCVSAGAIGRVIHNQFAKEDDWIASYKCATRMNFDFRS